MKLKLYQVDAFTGQVFTGNPAAVCVLAEWLPDALMQQIAAENNLSETAFTVKSGDTYTIRWFTPVAEVDLCGHATLATAYVLFTQYLPAATAIEFYSPHSGNLTVTRGGDWLTLDFPADMPAAAPMDEQVAEALGQRPLNMLRGKTDYLLLYATQEEVVRITPDFNKLVKTDVRGVIVSAPGKDVDFVSRFFGPRVGVNEDPVTGSAHTTLIPYWAGRLGKTRLTARQLSARGGYLRGEFLGRRVKISGQAVLYLMGEIGI